MASAIDATKPVAGSPTTQSVRDNFATAASEITALQAAPNQTITLSGDIAGSGTAAITTSLPTVNSNVGTFNNVTINAKGQATAGSNVAYAPLASPSFTGTARVSGSDGAAILLVNGATHGTRFGFSSTTSTIEGVDNTGVASYQTLAIGGSQVLIQNAGSTEMTVGPGGVTVGGPFGGLKGVGTLNAVTVYAGGVALTSDASLKTDVAPLPACLGLVAAIEPKSFRWREPEDPAGVPADFTTRQNWGFLAQDVKAAPGAHRKDGDVESIDLGGLVATLWQAVRELSAKVAELEAAR